MTQRDNKGRFLPGNQVGKGHGRPPKVREQAVLEAINEAVPAEDVAEHIRWMLRTAKAQNSWRGVEAALQLAISYQIGKPIARTQSATFSIEALLGEYDEDTASADDHNATSMEEQLEQIVSKA